MSTTHADPVPEHASRPARGWFDRLILGMNALGSVWILMLILLVSVDAAGRSFFSHPIVGVTELIQISIVGIIFLQLADAIRNGKLTRADSLLTWVARRSLRATDLMEAGFCLIGAVYMGVALWGTLPLLIESVQRSSFLGNQGVFTVVVWPVKLITVIGLAVCLLELLRQAFAAVQRARGRSLNAHS